MLQVSIMGNTTKDSWHGIGLPTDAAADTGKISRQQSQQDQCLSSRLANRFDERFVGANIDPSVFLRLVNHDGIGVRIEKRITFYRCRQPVESLQQ